MDRSPELLRVADELERLSVGLFAIERGLTGRPTEKPTHELARSIAYWMIALRRLARSGLAAWSAWDNAFPADPDLKRPIQPPARDVDEPRELVAELDVINCFITGDMALDDLAYAELVRRGVAPDWTPGNNIPAMWPELMRVLDGERDDPMRPAARYLDVTLAAARDVLVAHRDPTAWYMPSFANWGEVTLARETLDPVRRDAAHDILREVNRRRPVPWDVDDYHLLLEYLVETAPHLDRAARASIRKAYGLAGFSAPPLMNMVRRGVELVQFHATAAERLVREHQA